MSPSLRLALAFLLACGATMLLTPAAIALARRIGFYDRPIGYKGHLRPTPYLGGAAVVAALLVSAALFGRAAAAFWPIAAGALVLWALGTVDDRYGIGLLPRLAIEVAAGGALFAAGIGWSVFDSETLNLAFSIVFVVGVVNAYNLMDNMDGATGTVALVSGAVLGLLAAAHGNPALGAIVLALAGACAGFLPFNLASPSRVFLGDGGSVPIGFVLAATIMALPGGGHLGWVLIPLAVLLVGLPALDTALVIVSRRRRGAGVFTGGRDHLTHRLRGRLGSARRVAMALATGQAFLCGAGAVLFEFAPSIALAGSLTLILTGAVVVAFLESPDWAPAPSLQPEVNPR
jgi:UDP-GlcNAc:undecaprenyl-phosphate/decaprenyl-phosphate GlcNAc-1-phosphate transferase